MAAGTSALYDDLIEVCTQVWWLDRTGGGDGLDPILTADPSVVTSYPAAMRRPALWHIPKVAQGERTNTIFRGGGEQYRLSASDLQYGVEETLGLAYAEAVDDTVKALFYPSRRRAGSGSGRRAALRHFRDKFGYAWVFRPTDLHEVDTHSTYTVTRDGETEEIWVDGPTGGQVARWRHTNTVGSQHDLLQMNSYSGGAAMNRKSGWRDPGTTNGAWTHDLQHHGTAFSGAAGTWGSNTSPSGDNDHWFRQLAPVGWDEAFGNQPDCDLLIRAGGANCQTFFNNDDPAFVPSTFANVNGEQYGAVSPHDIVVFRGIRGGVELRMNYLDRTGVHKYTIFTEYTRKAAEVLNRATTTGAHKSHNLTIVTPFYDGDSEYYDPESDTSYPLTVAFNDIFQVYDGNIVKNNVIDTAGAQSGLWMVSIKTSPANADLGIGHAVRLAPEWNNTFARSASHDNHRMGSHSYIMSLLNSTWQGTDGTAGLNDRWQGNTQSKIGSQSLGGYYIPPGETVYHHSFIITGTLAQIRARARQLALDDVH